MMTKTTITKKIMTALLAIVVAIGFTVTMPSSANAADGLDMAGATQLSLGTPYWGTATASDDVNYDETFMFTTTGNNSYYNIFVTNSTYKNDLDVYIYNSDGVEIDQISWIGTHEKKYCTNKLEPNKKYYLRVYDASSDYKSGEFKLEVYEIKDDVGDDNYNAKNIALDKKYNAQLDVKYDSDWYKITATKTGTYSVEIINKKIDEYDLYVNFYNADIVKEYSDNIDSLFGNAILKYSMKLKAGQSYYIEAYRTSTGYIDQIPYSIKVISPKIAKPSKVAISSVKAGEKSLTVKFKRAKNATKYRVAVKVKSAKKWKYYTSKKLTKKITKLKTGKKYNVKVQGVRVVGGKSYYGKWSKTKTVTVK